MAGWLSRATSLFQQPPPPPEPFEVECDCGGKVTGERLSAYQKPACPACSRPVFVLPANVYPQPKASPKPPIPTARPVKPVDDKKAPRASANDVIDDSPTHPIGPKPAGFKKALRAQGSKTPVIPQDTIPLEPAKPWITPLRLVTFGIVVVSALTIGGLWRRNRIENAKSTVAKSLDAGKQALKDQDFVVAAREFENARNAVDILNRTDDTANSIRQYNRETTAMARLSTSTLTECLEETLQSGKEPVTDPVRMSSVHQGAWMIFDANVSAAGKDRCLVDAPMVLRSGIVQLEIESPPIYGALGSKDSNESQRVIFAAQLDQITAFKGEPPTSTLTLNGKTAFLWKNYDTYESIGYRPFDQENEDLTRAVLERQSHEK